MAKVSSVYVAAIVNGLPFFTRQTVDASVREMVRVNWPWAEDVPAVALQHQWEQFVSLAAPNGWVH